MDGGIGRGRRRFHRYPLVAEVVGEVVLVAAETAALRFSGEIGVCRRSLLVMLTPSETESKGCC